MTATRIPAEPEWADARRRDYPALAPVLKPRWLAEQAQLPPARQAELFHWLDPDGDVLGHGEAFCRSLNEAVQLLQGVPGVNDRLRMMQGEVIHFWSAKCELKMAATLIQRGIATTLHPDTPDLLARVGASTVGIELTAGFRTVRFRDLQTALAYSWLKPGRLILLAPDETAEFLTSERDDLVSLLASLSYDSLDAPVPSEETTLGDDDYVTRNEVMSADERRVPTEHLVDPARLEVFLGPAQEPVVVTHSGVRSGYRDPWPAIEVAVAAKARKLVGKGTSIVAFEAGMLHLSSNIWLDLVRSCRVAPAFATEPEVAGVCCYWQDATLLRPAKGVFVWNSAFIGDPAPVEAVIAVLGIPAAQRAAVA